MSAYVHTYIHTFIHTYRLMDMCAGTNTYMCVYYICTGMHTYVCIYVHGESSMPNTYKLTDSHVCLQTCMLAYMHIYITHTF